MDPVKVLLHRHRELCERAVDPLEIAAGLEAHGVTDRTAARFRHRDVFSLAEELYARVPRGGDDDGTASPADAPLGQGQGRGHAEAGPVRERRERYWVLSALLPGAVCGLAVAGHALTSGPLRLAVTVAGAAAVAAALVHCLRHGPLRAPGRALHGARAWTVLLLAYAAYGDGLLAELISGGPERPWPPVTAPLVGLALAVLPAAACARLFAVRARHRLAGSRGLTDFTARARPLLLAVVALHLAALTGLLALVRLVPGTVPGALAPAAALGTLLFLARLLTVHGYAESASAGLAAACAAEAVACASLLAGRLPGCDALSAPVRAAVETWGAASVPTLACGAAALALLAHATRALARASAHAPAHA
ncbi:hypothetical protein [Streptomyces sp. TRM64462]|uniref:hypothetical protein n=1 Tax=Streptomyces sp. TRM64462 TaxID=2741726 RepID=UPI002815B3D1|nr:hypothetical protein [Streptomyces sp. TRM64462]